MYLRVPIYVVYQKKVRKGLANFLKKYTNKTIDEVIESNFRGVPKNSEILSVGVGEAFSEIYSEKYKIK